MSFKPDKKIQKILAQYGSYAYVYRDGVILVEKKSVKIDKEHSTEIELTHVFPCLIDFRVYDYLQWPYSSKEIRENVKRLVIHDTKLIVCGLEQVEIAFTNSSEYAKEKGITINQIHFYSDLGMVWTVTNIPELISSGVSIQPDHTEKYTNHDADNSILGYIDSYYSKQDTTIIHGELPKR